MSLVTWYLVLTRLKARSKCSWSTPITTSPNMLINRRYASYANLRLPVAAARPSTAASVSPRFRMVCIIPGIETAAPERTETRSGFSLVPKFFPDSFSRSAMFLWTSFIKPCGRRCPFL